MAQSITPNPHSRFFRLFWPLTTVFLFLLFAHRAWYIPGTDFEAYFNAGIRASHGLNLYISENTPFKYLPVASYLFIPFKILPFQIAKLVFYILSFSAGFHVYYLIQKKSGNWVALAVLGSMLKFHNYDFLNSQVNHLLMWLLFQFFQFRGKSTWISSALYALLASFKIMPFVALGPLFFLRRFDELGKIGAWLCLFFILPLITFHGGTEIYRNWYFFLKANTDYPAPWAETIQSIPAALWYWIGPSLSIFQFQLLSYGTQLALLAVCCWAAWKATCEKKNISQQTENSLISAAIVLSVTISPLAWKHNYLLLLPSLWFLIQLKKMRIIGLSFLLMTVIPGILSLFSTTWADRSYGVLMGACLIFTSQITSSLYGKPAS